MEAKHLGFVLLHPKEPQRVQQVVKKGAEACPPNKAHRKLSEKSIPHAQPKPGHTRDIVGVCGGCRHLVEWGEELLQTRGEEVGQIERTEHRSEMELYVIAM